MPSNLSWPRLLIAAALLATACAPAKRDHHHELLAFGTYVSVSFYGVSDEQGRQALIQLENYFSEIGDNWYPWSDGELKRINEAIARGDSVEVSERLAMLIRLSAHYEFQSRGHFNAGLGRLSELWGLQPEPVDLPALPDASNIAAIVDSRPSTINLVWEDFMLSSPNPNLMLDLGGIAKGLILADSMEIIARHGVSNAIVNIGGDLSVMGDVNGRDAYVGIRSPSGPLPIAGLDVGDNETVVTSGNYERFIHIDGVRYTHIFDPSTGFPVDQTASVTVVDEDPVKADAAATALMVGGADNFDELVGAMELEYALLIDASGDTRLTPAMAERLHWIEPADEQ